MAIDELTSEVTLKVVWDLEQLRSRCHLKIQADSGYTGSSRSNLEPTSSGVGLGSVASPERLGDDGWPKNKNDDDDVCCMLPKDSKTKGMNVAKRHPKGLCL
ncbi:hypothetical protein SLA2020_496500 [Shorea laevis]